MKQRVLLTRNAQKDTAKSVGIIGGAGAEGAHVAEIMKNAGFQVAISDINTQKAGELCAKRGYSLMGSEEIVSRPGLAFLSLPIDVVVSEITRLSPFMKCDAVVDLSSAKTRAMETMLQHFKVAEIFSIHLQYRPTVSPWGQNVLMIPARPKEGGEWFGMLERIFTKAKAHVDRVATALDHDYEMGPLQVEPHALLYAFLTALKGLSARTGLERLQGHSTLLFRLIMDAAGRVVSDPNSGKMYGLIQKENPITKEVYDSLRAALDNQARIVASGDMAAFESMHRELNGFLGEYARLAAERTDRMMGHSMGLPIFYEADKRHLIEEALRGFRKTPEKYKEQLETTRIFEGDVAKLRKRDDLLVAREVLYKSKDAVTEGNFAFYVLNKRYPGSDKGLRLSPMIPEDPAADEFRDPTRIRLQMFNRYNDPFLNLFDTISRIPKLKDLGTPVAYGVK